MSEDKDWNLAYDLVRAYESVLADLQIIERERDDARAWAVLWKRAAKFERWSYRAMAALIKQEEAELGHQAAEIARLEAEALVTNRLLEIRMDLVNAIPPCPEHGAQCVPHAIEWVQNAQAEIAWLREKLAQLDGLKVAVAADQRQAAEIARLQDENNALLGMVHAQREELESARTASVRLRDDNDHQAAEIARLRGRIETAIKAAENMATEMMRGDPLEIVAILKEIPNDL